MLGKRVLPDSDLSSSRFAATAGPHIADPHQSASRPRFGGHSPIRVYTSETGESIVSEPHAPITGFVSPLEEIPELWLDPRNKEVWTLLELFDKEDTDRTASAREGWCVTSPASTLSAHRESDVHCHRFRADTAEKSPWKRSISSIATTASEALCCSENRCPLKSTGTQRKVDLQLPPHSIFQFMRTKTTSNLKSLLKHKGSL